MDDYISKPFSEKDLLVMVDKWTQKIDDSRLKIDDLENANTDPEQPSIINHQPSIINHQSSIINHQPSIINRQSSIINHQSKDVAPMNFERAMKVYEDDKAYLMEVLSCFLENVRDQIETIRQAISDGNAEAVRKEAHAMKGGAGILTADNLAGVASELENIGHSGALEGGTEALERLEIEFHRLEAYSMHV